KIVEINITTSPLPTSPNMNPKKSGYVMSQRTVGSISSLFGTPKPTVNFSKMLRTGIFGFCIRVGASWLYQSFIITSSEQIVLSCDLIGFTFDAGAQPSIK